MKTYEVTIRAIITKTLKIKATTEQSAVEQAHEEFSVLNEGDENYEQDTLNVSELT